jgi:hypothetical protein
MGKELAERNRGKGGWLRLELTTCIGIGGFLKVRNMCGILNKSINLNILGH